MKGNVLPVAGVVLALLAASCSSGPETGSEYPRLTPWTLTQPVSADTQTLHIAAESGACRTVDGETVGLAPLARVEVKKNPHQVVIGTYLGKPATPVSGACAGVGRQFPTTVRLDEPLGERELVDQACRKPKYHINTACNPETATKSASPAS